MEKSKLIKFCEEQRDQAKKSQRANEFAAWEKVIEQLEEADKSLKI